MSNPKPIDLGLPNLLLKAMFLYGKNTHIILWTIFCRTPILQHGLVAQGFWPSHVPKLEELDSKVGPSQFGQNYVFSLGGKDQGFVATMQIEGEKHWESLVTWNFTPRR